MKGDTEKLLDLAFGIATPLPADLSAGSEVALDTPIIEGDEGALPKKFKRNTNLALDAAAAVLQIKPDPESPNYGAEMRALVAASSNQVNAQLKVDEVAVRAQRNDEGVFKEILERIAAAAVEEKRLLAGDD